MTLNYYRDYQELFATCNGYWDLRGTPTVTIGSVSGTVTGATLTTDRFGTSNRAYAFSGSSQYITIGSTGVTIKSLVFWVKLGSTTQSILKLTDTPHKITISSGTISATGWPATVVIYVDGVVSSTISDTNWHLIAITTSGTAFTVSNLILGYDGSAYLTGSMGSIMAFSDQLSSTSIKTLYDLTKTKDLYPIQSGIRGVE